MHCNAATATNATHATTAGNGGVTSVAGKTGAVTLAKGDVGLGDVDNTADSVKSVSNAANLGGVAAASYSRTSHNHSGTYAPMTAVVSISNAITISEGGMIYHRCTATRANGSTFTFNVEAYLEGGAD